jgi:hypothetical protein
MPLGLRSRQQSASIRIAVGIAILIVYNQVLQFGQHMVESGFISASIAIWVPFLILALGSVRLFYAANSMLNQDPLTAVFGPIERSRTWAKIRSLALLKRRHGAVVSGEGVHIGQ